MNLLKEFVPSYEFFLQFERVSSPIIVNSITKIVS